MRELQAFVNDSLDDLLNHLATGLAEEREQYEKCFKALKARMRPSNHCTVTRDVLRQFYRETDPDVRHQLQKEYVKRLTQLMDSEDGKKYTQLIDKIDRRTAKLLRKDLVQRRSYRARRAKNAKQVFSKYAGFNRIDGAAEDAHGNADGEEYDLGRPGAYNGLRIVVLRQYPKFDFVDAVAALKEKGFVVEHPGTILGYSEYPPYYVPAPHTLDASLEDASQLWLIPTSYNVLSSEHIDVIVKHWRKGLGVYIFGDHGSYTPFFEDANRLLTAMFPSGLVNLSGNHPGGQTVTSHSADAPRGAVGFAPHHITTGLVQLFEGITVSSLNAGACATMGFDEVLRDHDGNLIVVARPSLDGCGPVIVDGAYTKLYCDWNKSGSARFVRNCACWLSTIVQSGEVDAEEGAASAPPAALNLDGAFIDECRIMCDTGPVALLATELPDPEQNTTDYALDNNLALARHNMVLCGQPIGINAAKGFLEMGQDPFSRRDVVCVIPLVSLDHPENLRMMKEMANRLFAGGLDMPNHSLAILLSVCEEMMHRESDAPDALTYLIDQLLRHARSVPDVFCTTAGAQNVPLGEALAANVEFAAKCDAPPPRDFPHTMTTLRLVARTGGLSADVLRVVARRAAVSALVSALRWLHIEHGTKALHHSIDDELYMCRSMDPNGMDVDDPRFEPETELFPVADSAHLVGTKNLATLTRMHAPIFTEYLRRIAAVVDGREVLPPSDATLLLVALRGWRGSWQVSLSTLIEQLRCGSSHFATVWACNDTPPDMAGWYPITLVKELCKKEATERWNAGSKVREAEQGAWHSTAPRIPAFR